MMRNERSQKGLTDFVVNFEKAIEITCCNRQMKLQNISKNLNSYTISTKHVGDEDFQFTQPSYRIN